MERTEDFSLGCPLPAAEDANILLAHGGGGERMHELIEKVFIPAFRNPSLEARHDGAVVELRGVRFAFTTDSYVVHPLFFPGGDIGKLAVNGTVNDLAMCGAHPLFLSAGFILEEGLSMETLQRVVTSMRDSAESAGVSFVTGDTKVVDKGKGDGLFINTAGIGVVEQEGLIGPRAVRIGDVILLNGDIGRHGIAVMAVREGLAFEGPVQSDCASLAGLVLELLRAGIAIHCMRDLTRGGLASALVEIAEVSQTHLAIEENAVPVSDGVRGACEILGLDPLYVANEGRFIAFVSPSDAERACGLMRGHPVGTGASIIGHVIEGPQGTVAMKNTLGIRRLVDRLSGEQLPRIC